MLQQVQGQKIEFEAGVTAKQLVDRAIALRPRIRADAPLAEKRGCYSVELHEAFKEAGFYKILQPRKFGGLELDISTFYKVMIEVSTGDPGIGWCLCLGAGHVLQVGSYFDEAAQQQIFGAERHFVAPMSAGGAGPNCRAVRTATGYHVTGLWRYCSGAPYSTHFMGLARIDDGGGAYSLGVVIVPRDQYKVLNDWGDILGLRASGSNSVEIAGADIPENFVFEGRLLDDTTGGAPGVAIHGNSMYGGPLRGFAVGELVCTQVGAIKAGLEEFEHIIRTTSPRTDRSIKKYQHHDWQRVFGLAYPSVLAAEAVLLRTGDLYMLYCEEAAGGGRPFDRARGFELMGMQHQAGKLAWDTGLELFRSSSSTSAKDGELMQRLFRDLSTFKNNASHQADFAAPEIAQAYFGLKVRSNTDTI